MRLDVELPAVDGVTLRGWLHLPQGRGPWPAAVLTHGVSATKEMGLSSWTAALAAAGIAVLAYDHRNLGASDGEPRQLVDPWQQARDQRAALGWLEGRPEVDPDRLAVCGLSYSGGQEIVLGAVDQRVRAVVACVPFVSARRVPDTSAGAFAAARSALLDEAAPPGAVTGPFVVVEEPGVDLPAFLPGPVPAAWFLTHGRRPGARWENRVLVRREAAGVVFDPAPFVERVAPTPLLLLVAEDDTVAPTAAAVAAFERAGEPKQLELLAGGHFGAFDGPVVGRATDAAVAFLRRWL